MTISICVYKDFIYDVLLREGDIDQILNEMSEFVIGTKISIPKMDSKITQIKNSD